MSYSRYRLVKPISESRGSLATGSSSYAPSNVSTRPVTSITNSTSSIKSMIESSNRLDELLKQCRQLGTQSTSSAPSLTSVSIPTRPTTVVSTRPVISTAPRTSSRYKISNISPDVTKKTLRPSSSSIRVASPVKKKVNERFFAKNQPIKSHHASTAYTYQRNALYVSRSKVINNTASKVNASNRNYATSNNRSCSNVAKTLDINTLLNRRVSDLSRNKFKFISSQAVKSKQASSRRLAAQRQLTLKLVNNRNSRLSLNTKFKIVRSASSFPINKYKVENRSVSQHKLNTLLIASNLLVRSKLTINRVVKKDTVTPKPQSSSLRINNKNKKYCMFYNRFGRCSRGDKCPYAHDPKRVSICPRFLRGTCRIDNCPYSHQASSEKIPACSFFIAGQCNRENCPYTHTYLGKDATFCVEFAKGFCPLGSKCDKLHIYECPDYMKSGECPRGSNCPLVHRNKKVKAKTPVQKAVSSSSELGNSFIHLNSAESVDSQAIQPIRDITKAESPIKIRPSFGFKGNK